MSKNKSIWLTIWDAGDLDWFTWTGNYIRLESEDPWVTWDYVIRQTFASGHRFGSCPKRQYTWTNWCSHETSFILVCFAFAFAFFVLSFWICPKTFNRLNNSKLWIPTFNTHLPINWMVALSNWIEYWEANSQYIHHPNCTQYHWLNINWEQYNLIEHLKTPCYFCLSRS